MTTYKELIETIKAELKHEVACKQWERRYNATFKPSIPQEQKEEFRTKLLAIKPENFYSCDDQNWRAKHIAYCLLRGRTLEQIEPNRNPSRSYFHKQADHYSQRQLAEWKEMIAEDIAAWEEKKRFRKETLDFQQGLSTQILLDMQEGK
jgi:hypothetical protein